MIKVLRFIFLITDILICTLVRVRMFLSKRMARTKHANNLTPYNKAQHASVVARYKKWLDIETQDPHYLESLLLKILAVSLDVQKIEYTSLQSDHEPTESRHEAHRF